jgi:4-carboxymuconolactone decarboxylase
VNPDHEDLLRRLALNDERALEWLLSMRLDDPAPTGLDARTTALVRLAGLVALDAAPASYQWGVTAALAVGATDGEVVGVLAALAPVVGTARVNAAAPEFALAIGYDVESPGDM